MEKVQMIPFFELSKVAQDKAISDYQKSFKKHVGLGSIPADEAIQTVKNEYFDETGKLTAHRYGTPVDAQSKRLNF